jgi:predicted amidophosphoribosyltransferase
MALKQCDKCSEMVDEAKAFCPACGNAFVEEERRSVTTNFEEMDMTVQLGQTMYNQMLSDMGLNVSKAPDVQEKVVEVAAAAPAVPLQPIAPATPVPTAQSVPAKSSNKWIWIIVGVIAAFILLGIVIVVVAAGVAFYLSPRAA